MPASINPTLSLLMGFAALLIEKDVLSIDDVERIIDRNIELARSRPDDEATLEHFKTLLLGGFGKRQPVPSEMSRS